MVGRISRAKKGICEYLENGMKKGNRYTRHEKDIVTKLVGNMNTLKKSEDYLNKYKSYSSNYTHITLGYSKQDLESCSKDTMKDIAEEYIKHHTVGYDRTHEVIAYAETHEPKIRLNEKGKERYEHTHIVISAQNAQSDTKLALNFATSQYIDKVFQLYIHAKYDLAEPRPELFKEKDYPSPDDTKIKKNRRYYIELLKNIKGIQELEVFLKIEKISYKRVKTKKNEYIKLITPASEQNINLQGKGFKHLQASESKNYDANYYKDLSYHSEFDLKEILDGYYEQRITEVNKRRSVSTTLELDDLNKIKELMPMQDEALSHVPYPYPTSASADVAQVELEKEVERGEKVIEKLKELVMPKPKPRPAPRPQSRGMRM